MVREHRTTSPATKRRGRSMLGLRGGANPEPRAATVAWVPSRIGRKLLRDIPFPAIYYPLDLSD